jgi:cell division protein FtsA
VLPQEFILDGQTGITDPVGMSGVRLESKVYIITAHSQSLHNLQKATEEAGLEVLDILLQPYASALAVMTKEEIENSTVLMDIGGGTTDIAVFRRGAMIHASILGIGGMHITNDLAVGLDISMAEAERIKRSAGDIFSTANGGVAEIKRQDGTMQTVEMRTIRSIVFPRCEELFEKANEELGMLRPKDRAGCTVILAGGTALMPGITGLASSVLHMPVRSGLPHGPVGLKNSYRSPVYAAGIGLIAHAAEREKIASKVLSASECSFAGKVKEFIGYRDFLDIFHKKKKGVSYV